MVEDCLPRSIQTKNVLCSAFEKKKKTYHTLVKIEENLLEVMVSREETCSARYLGMLTGQGLPSLWSGQGGFQGYQGLCNFPYPVPIFLNPTDTPSPAQIPLHPPSLPLILLSHQARTHQDLAHHRESVTSLMTLRHLPSVANTAVQKHCNIFISCFTFPAGLLELGIAPSSPSRCFQEPSPVPGAQTLKCDCPADTGDPGLEWRRPFNSRSKAST